MLYLVLCRYRNLLGVWTDEVHPVVFNELHLALDAQKMFADKKQAMTWVAEIPSPEFKPKFQLVDEKPSDTEVLDLGKLS